MWLGERMHQCVLTHKQLRVWLELSLVTAVALAHFSYRMRRSDEAVAAATNSDEWLECSKRSRMAMASLAVILQTLKLRWPLYWNKR